MASAVQCPSCGADLTGDRGASGGVCPHCTVDADAVATREGVSGGTMPTDDVRFLARLENDATADLACGLNVSGNADSLDGRPTIWGYQITGPPKRGGMGTVWPAKQLGTQRDVVVKTLVAQQSATARALFVREVELSARLQHPNIARVYDSGI